MEGPPDWTRLEERNTTLVCVMTDAPLDKAACARVARMASGGVARAVDPVFSDVDGDVAFCRRRAPAHDRPVHRDRGRDGRRDGDGGGDPRLRSRPPRSRQPSGSAVIFPARAGQVQDRGGGPAQHPLRRGGSVLHLYSATRGRIGAIAKGSRRPRSRFGGRLEPFFRLDLVLHEGRGELATVTAAHTVAAHPNLRADGAGAGGRGACLRRGAAPVRLRGAEPRRLQPALPLPGDARRLRSRSAGSTALATGPRAWRRRSPSGSSSRWRPASPRARLLRALRRGGRAGRVLRRGRRRRLRGV